MYSTIVSSLLDILFYAFLLSDKFNIEATLINYAFISTYDDYPKEKNIKTYMDIKLNAAKVENIISGVNLFPSLT